VLRGTFGPKRDELTLEWRTLHNREIKVLHFSPNYVLLIKSKVKCAKYVSRLGKRELYTWIWWRNLKERDLTEPGVDGRII
jgi:hypothetical protein